MPKNVDTWASLAIDRVACGLCGPNSPASGELELEMLPSNMIGLRSRGADCDLRASFRLVNSEVTS